MTRQPVQANLFAYGSQDSSRLAVVERLARSSNRYTCLWRPSRHWLVASAPIPGGSSVQPATNSRIAFAECTDATLDERASKVLANAGPCDSKTALQALPGDFSFLYFDEDGGATAVRSCAGLAPMYWSQDEFGTAFSTQTDALIRFAGIAPDLEPAAAAFWTMGFPCFWNNRTPIAAISGLMPGQYLHIPGPENPKVTIEHYWSPRSEAVARPGPGLVRERQQRFRDLLVTSLEQELDPAGGNLLSLSGGVDSSALLSLVARGLKRPVMTWSLIPSDAAPDAQTRELSYIRPLRQWAGVERYWEQTSSVDEMDALIAKAPEVPTVILHPALCALGDLLKQADVKVLLGGEFADEIAGSRFSTPDWAAGTSPWQLLRSFRHWPFGASAPTRWLKARALSALGRPYLIHPPRLPAFCPVALQSEYQDIRSQMQRWAMSLPAAHRYLFTRQQLIDFTPQNWEACSHYGIRRVIPFRSRAFTELAMECHPSELIGPDTKRLLRGALNDDVPHANLYRPDKGDFGLQFWGLRRPIADLRLDDDEVWGEIEHIVSPQWRQAVVQRGWIAFEDRYPLLVLSVLRRNIAACLPR